MAEWKKIRDYDNYSVSEDGRVRNDVRGTLLKPMLSTSGYLYVHFVADKKKKTKYIHRLVCQAFLFMRDGQTQVDHIDGNKVNNHISNLRWVTVSENHRAYGYEQRKKARCRKVVATNADGRELTFFSRKSAAEHFGCSPTKIKYGHRYVKSEKMGWVFGQS